jgi:hypothetical protein
MLVHMTPGEVGGLQALAMAHGGSLSINPNTGLPEAGFLKNLLPTLIGAGLMLIPGVNAVGAGLITGGIETARTGDIGKGFLAGLGAFGGANLAGGLMQQAGTSAAASAAGGAGAAGAGGAGTAGLQFADAASPEFLASQGAGTAGAAGAAGVPSSLGTTINPVTFGDTGAAIYGGTPSAAMTAPRDVFGNVLGVDEMASLTGDSSRVLTAGQAAPTFSSNAARLAQGTKNLFTKEGAFERFIGQAGTKADEKKGIEAVQATGLGGPMGAIKTAGLAAAPMIGDALTPEQVAMPEEEKSKYAGPYKPTRRQVSYPDDDLRRRTSEFTYFTPSNPIPFAEGGETASTSSGPDVAVSPAEARVYQDIMNVQRLAGLPALDPSRFAVMPGRSYEQFVYNPIEGGPVPAQARQEVNYGFEPLMSREEAEAIAAYNALPEEDRIPDGQFGSAFQKSFLPQLKRFTQSRIDTITSPSSQGKFAKGGVPMLEDGGFVLTKKAVDGLGKGSNKKGQRVASAGLGAIPIKGAGAKRGPKAGVDDKIKTSIEGKRPALVSNGEAYVPKKQVAKRGGAKAFYALMDKAEKQAKKAKRA